MITCKRCNRPLKSTRSVATEYGPTCKLKQEIADAEFLRIQITIDEELAYQDKVKRKYKR